MFGGKTSKPQSRIDSLIGEGTVVEGNVIFYGWAAYRRPGKRQRAAADDQPARWC